MTTTFVTSVPSIRPTGFEALLIGLGHRLIATGERMAVNHARHSEAVMTHDERRRDLVARHHSGLLP